MSVETSDFVKGLKLKEAQFYCKGYRKGVEDAALTALTSCVWIHDKELLEDCACYACETSIKIRALLDSGE